MIGRFVSLILIHRTTCGNTLPLIREIHTVMWESCLSRQEAIRLKTTINSFLAKVRYSSDSTYKYDPRVHTSLQQNVLEYTESAARIWWFFLDVTFQDTHWYQRHWLQGYYGPFYSHGLTWISNYMSSKACDEITYPFPNFNGAIVEVWEWISNFTPQFIMDAKRP